MQALGNILITLSIAFVRSNAQENICKIFIYVFLRYRRIVNDRLFIVIVGATNVVGIITFDVLMPESVRILRFGVFLDEAFQNT